MALLVNSVRLRVNSVRCTFREPYKAEDFYLYFNNIYGWVIGKWDTFVTFILQIFFT